MTAFLTAQAVHVRLSGRTVLNDISLALPAGCDRVGGAEGAGKTTLLRALAETVCSGTGRQRRGRSSFHR